MKNLKYFKQFLNEELKVLTGPTDEETEEVFNEMSYEEADKALVWSVKND